LFKSVGTALEDLATAQLVYEALKWNPHIYWPLVNTKLLLQSSLGGGNPLQLGALGNIWLRCCFRYWCLFTLSSVLFSEFNQVCLQDLYMWTVFPQGQVTAISTLFMSKLAILGADNKDNQWAPFHILYPWVSILCILPSAGSLHKHGFEYIWSVSTTNLTVAHPWGSLPHWTGYFIMSRSSVLKVFQECWILVFAYSDVIFNHTVFFFYDSRVYTSSQNDGSIILQYSTCQHPERFAILEPKPWTWATKLQHIFPPAIP
jgi:hypothetical protein